MTASDEVPILTPDEAAKAKQDFDDLAERVREVFDYKNGMGHQYAPRDKVDGLITHKEVAKVLGSHSDSEDVKYIVGKAKLLFCTLLTTFPVTNLTRFPRIAKQLRSLKVTDDFLPVIKENKQLKSLRGAPKDNHAMRWFSKDVQGETDYSRWASEFVERQWKFLVPVFSTREIDYQCETECVMPFEKFDELGNGASSTVYKAEIHPAHLIYHEKTERPSSEPAKPSVVAIKKINKPQDKLPQAYIHQELEALKFVQKKQHPHIIEFITSYWKGGDHYLLFEWAEHGDLTKLWESPLPCKRHDVVKWAIDQMKGVVEALNDSMHRFGSKEGGLHCRHGDLKPANLVRCKSTANPLGCLKITDLGLAKIHNQNTTVRDQSNTTGCTNRYQSYEFWCRGSPSEPTSRSYDWWSMGCIILEFCIWLTHGDAGEKGYRNLNKGTRTRFFVEDKNHFQLESWVKTGIESINDDPKLMELVKLVEDELLIEDHRKRKENSRRLSQKLECINAGKGLDSRTSGSGQAPSSQNSPHKKWGKANTQNEYAVEFQPECWETCDNNEMALAIFRNISKTTVTPDDSSDETPTTSVTPDDSSDETSSTTNTSLDPPEQATRSCEKCENIFSSTFEFQYVKGDDPPEGCDFCRVLWDQLDADGKGESRSLIKYGSHFRRSLCDPPEFSIIVGPGISNVPNDLQRSFPILPDFNSGEEAFAILQQWLEDCDTRKTELHRKCNSQPKVSKWEDLPKRLVSVDPEAGIGLHETSELKSELKSELEHKKKLRNLNDGPVASELEEQKEDLNDVPAPVRYIALSYRWDKEPSLRLQHGNGDPVQDTVKRWLSQDKEEIVFDEMPKTLQDAVTVTRQLGVEYLWVDALCIIQDDDDDWEAESKRMGLVYSGAYCTVAATRAKGAKEGFLKREPRFCRKIRMNRPDGEPCDLYLVRSIDNFQSDVEKADLNTRGWVFQERLLSRRTLHFAESQVYMECGAGICCETTTHMYHRLSCFYSDPEFPSQVVKYKGPQIEYFEKLYEDYTQREFSPDHEHDRAVAMEGLESKILDKLESAGRYGIIKKHFCRSLMWQRAGRNPMTKIECGKKGSQSFEIMNKVPTWSWMKLKGHITYFPIELGGADWNKDLSPPFEDETTGLVDPQPFVVPVNEICPKAYDNYATSIKKGSSVEENVFILDEDADEEIADEIQKRLKCVVVGGSVIKKKLWKYVLLVTPRDSEDGSCQEYERVGVAQIKAEFVLGTKEDKRVTLM